MGRTVTLVVVDPTGAPLGTLPPFDVEFPFACDVADVVAGARERFGVELTVLRLLATSGMAARHQDISYLAEAAELPAGYAAAVSADLGPHPRRLPYAEPGGPAAALAWATRALADLGRPLTAATQQRTWNLSTIWRLDTVAGPVWLKVVPPFLAHEPAALRLVVELGGPVPALLAEADARMLLEHVPGTDLHRAGLPVRAAIGAAMHAVQRAAAGQVDRLIAAGVPDRRGPALVSQLAAVVAAHGDGDPRLARLVAGLPGRLAALAACGLPDTLVHGDLHPGNARGDGGPPVIIDWGDSFVGHPGFDALRLAQGLAGTDARTLLDGWAQLWRRDVPGSDPLRALELLAPVAPLRAGAVYADFLDQIEPAEQAYHVTDVPEALARAAALA